MVWASSPPWVHTTAWRRPPLVATDPPRRVKLVKEAGSDPAGTAVNGTQGGVSLRRMASFGTKVAGKDMVWSTARTFRSPSANVASTSSGTPVLLATAVALPKVDHVTGLTVSDRMVCHMTPSELITVKCSPAAGR